MRTVKIYISIGLVLILIIIFRQLVESLDGKMQIVICDVGQGDAVYIKTPSGKELVFDGGPDDSVLKCLDEFRPFWDRKIDVVILSHPHYDHFRGLIDVLDKYNVGLVLHENLINQSTDYKVFAEMVDKEKVDVRAVLKGTQLHLDDDIFLSVLGPDMEFINSQNPEGVTDRDNPPSLILHLAFNSFDMLLTADSDGEDLIKFVPSNMDIEIMQIPHHGSRNGYTSEVSQRIKSEIAVISMSDSNSYGHPHKEVLDELKKNKTLILRTDEQGSIRFKVDRNGEVVITDKKYDKTLAFF